MVVTPLTMYLTSIIPARANEERATKDGIKIISISTPKTHMWWNCRYNWNQKYPNKEPSPIQGHPVLYIFSTSISQISEKLLNWKAIICMTSDICTLSLLIMCTPCCTWPAILRIKYQIRADVTQIGGITTKIPWQVFIDFRHLTHNCYINYYPVVKLIKMHVIIHMYVSLTG